MIDSKALGARMQPSLPQRAPLRRTISSSSTVISQNASSRSLAVCRAKGQDAQSEEVQRRAKKQLGFVSSLAGFLLSMTSPAQSEVSIALRHIHFASIDT